MTGSVERGHRAARAMPRSAERLLNRYVYGAGADTALWIFFAAYASIEHGGSSP